MTTGSLWLRAITAVATPDPEHSQAMLRASCSLPSTRADAADLGSLWDAVCNSLPGKCLWKAKNRDQTPNFIKTNKSLILLAACLYSQRLLGTFLFLTRLPTVRKESTPFIQGQKEPNTARILFKSDLRISFLSRLFDPTTFILLIFFCQKLYFRWQNSIFWNLPHWNCLLITFLLVSWPPHTWLKCLVCSLYIHSPAS